jgi:murein DD-endopeptidase MepM/ murein hydrolase activator NlpD
LLRAGTVLLARRMSEFGNLVSIKHADGLETRYAHLSHIAVAEGDCVGNGTVIGLAGSTGLVDGVQLHFEVRRDDHPLDPLPFLPAAR